MNSMNQSILLNWNRIKTHTAKLWRFPLIRETRTHILFWYVVLMLFLVAASIPATRQRLNTEVNERVVEDMEEEIEEFEEFFLENLLNAESNPSNLSLDSAQSKMYGIFDEFLASTIPEDDNFAIAIVDGQFYKASSLILPQVINPNSELMGYWENLTTEETDEVTLSNSQVGSILYQAIPIKTTSETLGVFVVAHTTAGERQEAVEALGIVAEVLILLLAIALILAWFASGIVLSPLKQLTQTARSINESDLTQRISISGKGELAQLGQTFNEMMNRIEGAFATQRNFINDAGHELKTPITIIRGHLELIDDDPQERQETIDLVIDELDRMNRLVEDLILLAKAERPDFLQIETIDVASFVAELFSKLKTLGKINWQLEYQILSGTFYGDRQRITQAIINLAQNAVQHTTTDSLIVFSVQRTGDCLAFSIRDTGEGIAPEEQERIFNRFARVKNTPRRSEGSGLGLAIVKAIVEAHHGSIQLQSQLGVGSTFTLNFPAS